MATNPCDNNFKNQIENRNFLTATQFKFTITRAPKAAFFSNSANIPSLELGVAKQPTQMATDLPTPGDRVTFEDFKLRFLVDEDLENYREIQKWIRGLGYPFSLKQIYDLQNERTNIDNFASKSMDIYSDGTLFVLNSNQRVNFQVKFYDLFPFRISTIQFDATDTDPQFFTAEVAFKYAYYDILDSSGRPVF
jgi:hypothetical protein